LKTVFEQVVVKCNSVLGSIQHFMRDFFADILAPKNCKAKRNYRKAAQFAFVQKTRAYNVDEIDYFSRFNTFAIEKI